MAKNNTETRIDPLYITINEKNEEYTLDFSKESLKYMASQKFTVDDGIFDLIADKGLELWYYAFRMHHRRLSRQQTDAILDTVGGLTPKILERLFLLYNQALMSNSIIQDDEELEKNSRVTVKF